MKRQTEKKWYSNGLTPEKADKLQRLYAKIENPIYGLTDRDNLALQFHLSYENNGATDWGLADVKDIKALFERTHTSETSQLAGKVIESYIDDGLLRGISVNPNLV